MSDITELPNAWSKDLVFNSKENTLYIAYSEKGVWQLNLTTQSAKQITDVYATELAFNVSQLLMKSDGKLYSFDFDSKKTTHHHAINGRVLSISAYKDKSYVLTSKGAYLLVEKSTRLIEPQIIINGEIQ
ncbi:hypothetical protein, partial [Pseudoalteromonas sp. NBT06-2]|uniref:hypothetical protein n=1 Tax=Pseudoalteromonas sp. NBT06-2 TaxID=2025950 RepID=UPI0011410587